MRRKVSGRVREKDDGVGDDEVFESMDDDGNDLMRAMVRTGGGGGRRNNQGKRGVQDLSTSTIVRVLLFVGVENRTDVSAGRLACKKVYACFNVDILWKAKAMLLFGTSDKDGKTPKILRDRVAGLNQPLYRVVSECRIASERYMNRILRGQDLYLPAFTDELRKEMRDWRRRVDEACLEMKLPGARAIKVMDFDTGKNEIVAAWGCSGGECIERRTCYGTFWILTVVHTPYKNWTAHKGKRPPSTSLGSLPPSEISWVVRHEDLNHGVAAFQYGSNEKKQLYDFLRRHYKMLGRERSDMLFSGGRLTFNTCPTGIGIAHSVSLRTQGASTPPGVEKLDYTDYDDW